MSVTQSSVPNETISNPDQTPNETMDLTTTNLDHRDGFEIRSESPLVKNPKSILTAKYTSVPTTIP